MDDLNDTELPDIFIEQVKETLENLYNYPVLHRLPLGRIIAPQYHTENKGHALRQEIIRTIESLNPGDEVYFRSPGARIYNLLNLHYVERLPLRETADELSISLRQCYRDLKRAQEMIAEILWFRYKSTWNTEVQPEPERSDNNDLGHITPSFQTVEFGGLLTYAVSAVQRLADQLQIRLELDIQAEQSLISTDPTIARQILVQLLSQAVQWVGDGGQTINICLQSKPNMLVVTFNFYAVSTTGSIDDTLTRFTTRLGWHVRQKSVSKRERGLLLEIPIQQNTILVIDDNEGLIELISRYLTSQNCQVIGANSGLTGLELARQRLPQAIILDVMMPEVDGWEILQRLRTSPPTAHITVIVCSVFKNPDLAYALGASEVLVKPVTEEDVLSALRRVRIL